MSREVIYMGRPHKCPYCGQSESVSKGVRRTKTMGDRRIRRCKACKRKFTPKNQKPGDVEEAPTLNSGPATPPAVPEATIVAESPVADPVAAPPPQ